ncbi:MAG: carbon-nitrogen hydrolase family protein, partial [Bacteroidales bacterium]
MLKNHQYKTIVSLILITLTGMTSYSQGRQVSIAMAQIFCIDGDRPGNFVRIKNAVTEAVEKGADIVCFPETSILGWVNPDAHQLAYPVPGKDSDRLCELAKNNNIFISIGLAEKDGEKLFDAALLIDNKGNILLKHRKINILDQLMTPPYSPGSTIEAVNTQIGRIGILICADSFQDELLTRMEEQDPDFVIIPYGWAKEKD